MPSGLYAMESTEPGCTTGLPIGLPFAASQTRVTRSAPPVTKVLPSGLKATVSACLGCGSGAIDFPSRPSKRREALPTTASVLPSGTEGDGAWSGRRSDVLSPIGNPVATFQIRKSPLKSAVANNWPPGAYAAVRPADGFPAAAASFRRGGDARRDTVWSLLAVRAEQSVRAERDGDDRPLMDPGRADGPIRLGVPHLRRSILTACQAGAAVGADRHTADMAAMLPAGRHRFVGPWPHPRSRRRRPNPR